MKYKELFTPESGLFTTIFKVEFPDEYLTLFGDIEPEELDLLTNLNYGDKELSYKFDEIAYNSIIKSILKIKLKTWLTTGEILSLDYDILNPISETITKTGNNTINGNDINISLTANKPFNDGEFTDHERTGNDKDSEKIENYSDSSSRVGTGSNISIVSTLEEEIKFRQYNFSLAIVKSIVDEITLKIY